MAKNALDWLTNWLEDNLTTDVPVPETGQAVTSLTEQCLLAMVSAGLAPDDIEPVAGMPLERIISEAIADRSASIALKTVGDGLAAA